MLEDLIDYGAWFDPGRDEHSGDADTEAVEVEGVWGTSGRGLSNKAIRFAGGWRDVIVDATVFVVHHENRGVGPKVGVIANGVINRCDELLSRTNVMIGMLVASGCTSSGRTKSKIDEASSRVLVAC